MKLRIVRLVTGAVLAVAATSRLVAGTFTVTNTADSGAGSLRQAITDANALAGIDTINFNIPGAGVHTISPASPVPSITGPVTIDGYTQPGAAQNTDVDGFNGTLLIELNGTNAGVGSSGLTIDGGNGTIRGMVINRFGNVGINLNSSNNLVEGNFIGTNAAGTTALGNGGQAIRIDSGDGNLVGGTAPEARNIISGNDEGMEIRGVCNSNVVEGNFIGTNAAGTGALGNLSNGIRITNGPTQTTVGASVAGARNVISEIRKLESSSRTPVQPAPSFKATLSHRCHGHGCFGEHRRGSKHHRCTRQHHRRFGHRSGKPHFGQRGRRHFYQRGDRDS